MPTTDSEQHERSAAGLDFDEGPSSGAADLGSKLGEEGANALFDEIENMLPGAWREQIRAYPIAAMALGVGVGVWLGLKKSSEIIAAGGSLVSAAAMTNISQIVDRMKQG